MRDELWGQVTEWPRVRSTDDKDPPELSNMRSAGTPRAHSPGGRQGRYSGLGGGAESTTWDKSHDASLVLWMRASRYGWTGQGTRECTVAGTRTHDDAGGGGPLFAVRRMNWGRSVRLRSKALTRFTVAAGCGSWPRGQADESRSLSVTGTSPGPGVGGGN